MSNTIRIKTTPNGDDKYIKVNLEQEFDFIEILSLKISQDEAYTKFCSDYGTIVGRVTVNNGFGVPNAKVSVFLPIDENDKKDSEIRNLYPFETVNDKTTDGKRYNLLPKNPVPDNDCFTPIGTFPNKREVLDNPTILEIYCKYYKHTTTTNHAGDFMLFGVPLGTYTVHVDADVSDIGIISQRPYDLISQGTPEKMFESPTKFKGGNNLDKLVQIKTANIGVNVQPFWGDTDNCEVGITRLDIPLNFDIIPSAIFMGSIFGDNEKNSLNRHCRPRDGVGSLCEQVTGEGTIEMIRKTNNGDIERFDVNGGRLIDEDGTWAYQVPMNLEYMTTDEEGNLIYSQDPTVGIPTKASVRFRIGMDETGGEGRKRVRGKFLVPNNPNQKSEVDYSFGSASDNNGNATKDSSLYDMYWNKIYTVKSFIPRFQRTDFVNGLPYVGNNYTGIKDVDDDSCTGVKTPFPYNRFNTENNPIFFIICIIVTLIFSIVSLINIATISLLNNLIWVIRGLITIIETLIDSVLFIIKLLSFGSLNISKVKLPKPPYIPCIFIKTTCGSDEDKETVFAPFCFEIGKTEKEVDLGLGFGGGNFQLSKSEPIFQETGFKECIAFKMAKSMGMFKFDFYNEWVNGSLYAYLFKYKRKRPTSKVSGRETFCEYDCDEFAALDDATSVDSNKDGNSDNLCGYQYLVDTCYSTTLDYDAQNKGVSNGGMFEGLIKKVDNTFYYAATTHYYVPNAGGPTVDTKNNKLFATGIVCLGSIFERDWQGVPKLKDLLVPTTYKSVPSVAEKDIINGEKVVVESGMLNASSIISSDPAPFLFFNVDCIGVHVPYKGCNNVRHICEFGVEIDEIQYGANNLITPSDGIIGSKDIDTDNGKLFRDYFYLMNKDSNSLTSFTYPSKPVTSEFNINNKEEYDFVSINDNGSDYLDFKGYTPKNATVYSQPNNSYYFYFGLNNNKTALHKMNSRYFIECYKPTKIIFFIKSETKNTDKKIINGSITFSFKGGILPVKWKVTGPNKNSNGVAVNEDSYTFYNLGEGIYTISATDSLGNITNKNVIIYGPQPLKAYAYVSKNAKTTTSNDGEITIQYISSGVGPYTYILKDDNGIIVKQSNQATSGVITNLPYLEPIGYTLTISDSSGETIVIDKLIIKAVPIVSGDIVKTDSTCGNIDDGTIDITPKYGKSPYSYIVKGPNGFSSTNASLSNLPIGTYTITITDSSPTPQNCVLTTQINNINPKMTLTLGTTQQLNKQCSNIEYTITFTLDYEFSPPLLANIEYLDIKGNWVLKSVPYINNATPMEIKIPIDSVGNGVSLRVRYGTSNCYSDIITISKDIIQLPKIPLYGVITTTQTIVPGVYTHILFGGGGKGFISSSNNDLKNIGDSKINNSSTMTTTLTDGVGCSITIKTK